MGSGAWYAGAMYCMGCMGDMCSMAGHSDSHVLPLHMLCVPMGPSYGSLLRFANCWCCATSAARNSLVALDTAKIFSWYPCIAVLFDSCDCARLSPSLCSSSLCVLVVSWYPAWPTKIPEASLISYALTQYVFHSGHVYFMGSNLSHLTSAIGYSPVLLICVCTLSMS